MNKSELRSELRRRRRAVSGSKRKLASEQIVRHVSRSGLLQRYQHVGLYLPHGNEINTLPLINHVLNRGKSCYLPMLPYGRGKKLWFNRLQIGNRWHLNRFGIAENHSMHAVRAQRLDLLFMPLLGYDDAGYRIGMGGGYYDASLSFLMRRRCWRRPYLVGVAFACQRVAELLPRDAWDIPLNAILTEQKLHQFKRY